MSVYIRFRVLSLVMSPFNRFVRLLPPSLQWIPWPPLAGALRFSTFVSVGSEVAHKVALTLATVRRSNCTCGFPAYSFHEDTNYEIRSTKPCRVGPAPHLSG